MCGLVTAVIALLPLPNSRATTHVKLPGNSACLELAPALCTPFSHSSCSEAGFPGRGSALPYPFIPLTICRAAQKLGLGIRMQSDTDGLAIFDGQRFVMQQVRVNNRGSGFLSFYIPLWLHISVRVKVVHECGLQAPPRKLLPCQGVLGQRLCSVGC